MSEGRDPIQDSRYYMHVHKALLGEHLNGIVVLDGQRDFALRASISRSQAHSEEFGAKETP